MVLSTIVKIANKIKLTTGPAIATKKDCSGVSDSFPKAAKPPKMNKVMGINY